MTTALTVDEYRDLMSSALPSAQDADTVEPSLSSLFTPDSHRAALHIDATVVRGGRGVGKTFWYRSLLDESLRTIAADEYRIERLRNLSVHEGYGAGMAPELYPSPGEMSSLVEEGVRPYDLWNAVLLTALKLPEFANNPHQGWLDRVQWVRSNPAERDRAIAQADQQATGKRTTVLILFDALEHLHWDRAEADRLVAGILQMALEMRLRTKNIRFKVFIRPDMFDGALLNFPDASKLTANAANLQWSRTNLYGLFFHYLGNANSQESLKFRTLTGDWTEHVEGRHLPPPTLRGDETVQAETFSSIAGPYMGANYRKGITYTWLPNHLMDGVEQVSPRSFLNALVKAVEETRDNFAGHEFALNHEGIRRGVQSASQIRVAEMREDIPWVSIAVEPLRGQQVPIDPSLVLDLWAEDRLADQLHLEMSRAASSKDGIRTGPRYADNPQRLIDELIVLGVMRRRKDGRIDLPDVYRIAFSIGRRGGVPMVQG